MSIAREVRLLRHGRDWRGRAVVPRSARPWAPAREPQEFPTAWARTPTARAARAMFRAAVMKPLMRVETDLELHGLDLLDEAPAPAVFVANHGSHLDTPLMLSSLPPRFAHRTAVAAATDYFFDVRWRALATAFAFNTFPVERRGSRGSLDLAEALLSEGWSLLVFPEGTRTKDGWMRRFRLGAALLCRTFDVPAVPVAVRGSYAAMPRGLSWPRRGRRPVAVRFGGPLMPTDGESLGAFGVRLEEQVARLWVEHDVGWWGSLRADDRRARTRGPDAAHWRRVWETTRPPAREQDRVWPR
ncbi:MAG: lysophospholipid acyltransferase family protein [Streptosporangiaceae bacterium]